MLALTGCQHLSWGMPMGWIVLTRPFSENRHLKFTEISQPVHSLVTRLKKIMLLVGLSTKLNCIVLAI